jgi:hypothetical protein
VCVVFVFGVVVPSIGSCSRPKWVQRAMEQATNIDTRIKRNCGATHTYVATQVKINVNTFLFVFEQETHLRTYRYDVRTNQAFNPTPGFFQ